MFRDEHMNFYTIFKSPQLLERFGTLKWRGFPFYKLQQRSAPRSVDALMPQIHHAYGAIVRKWDGEPRKIERVAAKIDNDLHLMWRRGIRWILKRMCGGDDLDLAIRA